MDFKFTDEQEMLRNTMRSFVVKECQKEYARKLDESKEFPHELWGKMCDIGLLGLPIAEKYGGTGGNIIDVTLVSEELSRGMFAAGLMFMTFSCFGSNAINFIGDDQQKQEYLPRLAKGEIRFCLGVTEPQSGSDTLALRTTAKLDGDNFVINGQKVFTSGALVSDFIVLMARTQKNPSKQALGISLFVVPTKSVGITIRRLNCIGLRAFDTCEVFYDDVKVPKSNLLGEENRGWYHLLDLLNNERIGVASLCIGTAQAAFEDSLKYAKERIVFNRPIGQFQVIQHYLSNMATQIELARLITYKAAWLQSNGQPCGLESNMAKLAASEAALYATSKGMEIYAGHGYTYEYDIQRYWRDVKLYEFAPISNEMVRNIIGQMIGLPKSY